MAPARPHQRLIFRLEVVVDVADRDLGRLGDIGQARLPEPMPVRQSYGGLLLNTELKKEYLATCHHFQIYQDWVEVKYLETAEHLRDFGKKAGYKIVEVWKGIASGPKQERAERKKLLALAQARTVDLILVTELTRWGRSARFAARSLTCFKLFRVFSSS
ncbi:MAG: recombinase family protein [Chthoniobacterales bacterium]